MRCHSRVPLGPSLLRPCCAALLVIACGLDHPLVAHREDAVLAATNDPQTTSVFLLNLQFDNGHSAICSATLISPKVLLTAGHCIDPSREGATSVIVSATNKADDSALHASDFIAVTKLQRGSVDIGLLLLATAPLAVTPAPLVRTPPNPWVGQTLRLVGYGRTSAADANSSGTRRSASAPVTSVSADSIGFGVAGVSGICSGDSGGPAFITQGGVEQVAGVHSMGSSNDCGVATDVRVDAQLAFIDPWVAANDPASCSADGRCATGCTTPDPDCAPACATSDGVCSSDCTVADPDCLTDGDVCTQPTQCATRQCVADSRGFSFCSRACSSDASCQRSMVCQSGSCRIPPEASDGGLDSGGAAHGGCAIAPGLEWLSAAGWVLVASARRRRRGRR